MIGTFIELNGGGCFVYVTEYFPGEGKFMGINTQSLQLEPRCYQVGNIVNKNPDISKVRGVLKRKFYANQETKQLLYELTKSVVKQKPQPKKFPAKRKRKNSYLNNYAFA